MLELKDKCNCDVVLINRDKEGKKLDERIIGNYDYYELARDVAGTELYHIQRRHGNSYIEIRRYSDSGCGKTDDYEVCSFYPDEVGYLDPWISREEEDNCIKRLYEYSNLNEKKYKEKDIIRGDLKLIWSRRDLYKYIFLDNGHEGLVTFPNSDYIISDRDDLDPFIDAEITDQFLKNNLKFYEENKPLLEKLSVDMPIEPSKRNILYDLKYFNIYVKREHIIICNNFRYAAIDMDGNYYGPDASFPKGLI